MIIDTSALVAILTGEADAEYFADQIANADTAAMSAGSLVELGIVCIRRPNPISVERCRQLIADCLISIIPVDAAQAEFAWDAYARFGKGRHPAGLNYGDCFAYALSKASGEPLLFKGADFAATDVTAAQLSS